MTDKPLRAAAMIQAQYPHFKPRIAIILGSGLGQFANTLEEAIHIPYSALPGFPEPTVQGHEGYLVLAYWHKVPVVCLQGRAHRYEGLTSHEAVKTYVRTLKRLGCEYCIATNAAGSLRKEVAPGQLMLITDHINLQGDNPLLGPNDDVYGPRFYPLDTAYAPHVRQKLLALAKEHHIALAEGVYLAVTGPHYETAAEIRAFKVLGADVVGMSTVPEVLVANHCGLKVGVISTITNYATGLAASSHSHEAVLAQAGAAEKQLNTLLKAAITDLA